ncbi:MAG: YhcH/YjgK/YiaL family protein [Fibrobacteria bacterium]
MSYFGTIDELSKTFASDPRFTRAFAYLERCRQAGSIEAVRLASMDIGVVEKIPMDDGSVAMDQVYRSKERKDCFFESHVLYIDVQCVLAGEEIIDLVPTSRLEVVIPYQREKDVTKYRDTATGEKLCLGPGQVAVFFPEDGHMPGQAVSDSVVVRKTVIKVPVTPGVGIRLL